MHVSELKREISLDDSVFDEHRGFPELDEGEYETVSDEDTAAASHSLAQSSVPFFCQKSFCSKDDPESCNRPSKPELCHYHKDLKPACFAVWKNSTEGGITVLLKGCWVTQSPEHNECRPEKCETDRLQTRKEHGAETFFCCCEKSNCNAGVNLLPAALEELTPRNNQQTAVKIDGSQNQQQQAESSTINSATLLLGTFVPLFLVALLFLIAYFVYRRARLNRDDLKKKKSLKTNVTGNNGQHDSLLQPAMKYQIKSLISRGHCRTVYKASLDDGSLVAVKVFPASDQDSWVQEQDIYKTSLMAQHDNILRFLAADVSKSDPREYLLFTVYHENGSLYDYLKAHTLSFQELLYISTSMMRGLAFLHEEQRGFPSNKGISSGGVAKDEDYVVRKPTIVHRDFKSRNVLLKSDLTACISDFGLALKCENGRTPKEHHSQVGTKPYMAPEVLQGATEFSAFAFKQIDVYAAALVLWELLWRCNDIDNIVDDYRAPFEEYVGLKPDIDDMRDCVVVRKLRPTIKNIWMRDLKLRVICQTIREMWDDEFEARLTIHNVHERLRALQDGTADLTSCSLNSLLNFSSTCPSAAMTSSTTIMTSSIDRGRNVSSSSSSIPQPPPPPPRSLTPRDGLSSSSPLAKTTNLQSPIITSTCSSSIDRGDSLTSERAPLLFIANNFLDDVHLTNKPQQPLQQSEINSNLCHHHHHHLKQQPQHLFINNASPSNTDNNVDA